MLAGKGNNGGDGLVAARHLENEGAHVRVFLFGSPEELSPDAAVNYKILTAAGGEVVVVPGRAGLAASATGIAVCRLFE